MWLISRQMHQAITHRLGPKPWSTKREADTRPVSWQFCCQASCSTAVPNLKKKKSVQYCPPQETFSSFIVSPPTGGYRFVSICANSCEKLTITTKGVWLVALVLEILYLLEVVSKQAKSLYYYKVCRYLHELKYIMAYSAVWDATMWENCESLKEWR